MGDFLSRKKWVVSRCDKDVAADIAENCGVDPLAAFILCSRGMTDDFEIDSFLYDTDLTDPFMLPDMEKAVERVTYALENGEKITVFGDYDADGVTSTAVVYMYLSSRGANVDCYIPDRAEEGYGMNKDAISALKEQGTQLIITVDNGISAVEEIEYANTLGIDVVVTDHHKAGEILPNAVAVVDPHREDCYCDFREWAGVGVAFKFICAIDGGDGYDLLEEYADIVTIGTVADIVPLVGENRIIVRNGIGIINYRFTEGLLRPGLKALLDLSGANGKIDANSVAFRLAPRINAAGRMGSAKRALKLLLCEDEGAALEIAQEIAEANTQRQSVESHISEAAIASIESDPSIKYNRVIVVEGEDWHQGVIGIVASRIVEKYGKPCIVISKNGNSAKGSGRSLGNFSLYDALTYCSDLLTQYGGHTLAAGLSIESDKIALFRERINQYALSCERPVPVLNIDCKVNPASVSFEMLDALQILEPYGAENAQPVLGLYNMEICGIQYVGNGNHVRMQVRRNGISLTVVKFFVTPLDFYYKVGDTVDLAVKIERNEYQGKPQLNIQVKDIKFSNSDNSELIDTMHSYDDFRAGNPLTAEEKEKLFVDRDFCVKIYKFLKSGISWEHPAEYLCRRLNLPESKCAACQTVLDIFTELGVLQLKDDVYTFPVEPVKVELENSPLFKKANSL